MLHALLLVDVPDEDLVVIRVGSQDSAVGRPAPEAVYLSWVDDDLCHLKFGLCLLALLLLLVGAL